MRHLLVVLAFAACFAALVSPSSAEANNALPDWFFRPHHRHPPRPPPPHRRHVPEFDPSAAGLVATLIAGSAVVLARRRSGR